MKALKTLTLAILLILPFCAFSADQKIICEPPSGTRLDYFTTNAMNLENNKFIMARDRLKDLQPVIILHDNKKDVTLYFQKDNQEIDFTPRNMQVVFQNLQIVTFVGMFNNAPVMASYYPLHDVLVYTQQSIWPGGGFSGARALMFYSKCEEAVRE